MFRNQSVDVHRFAMTPRADIPRSSFRIEHTHKTTLSSGYLVPIYVDEILPGDSFNLSATIFARMATPIYPLMDNLYLDTFFFFVPNRLLWDNWVKFMGEQDNPGDSISYILPTCTSPVGGYAVGSVQDYFGLPSVGMIPGQSFTHMNLPLRAYNFIYNEWFRDENLQSSVTEVRNDGPDTAANYVLLRRGKRPDYITTALPWPQKGGTAVTLPLGTSAPIYSSGVPTSALFIGDSTNTANRMGLGTAAGANPVNVILGTSGAGTPNMYADLSQATAATINQIRQAFQIQRFLERDARGGTRYVESILSHFGVRSPDYRLDRPEYLGGGSTPISINPIAQTSATGLTGGTAPVGTLAAMGTAVSRNGFSQSFTEHGFIIGLAEVRADLTYQQGVRKMWNRSTRYDFYYPVFAHLGEQTVLNREIYVQGTAADTAVFGYQERWGEYRYHPSRVSGLFRSTAAGTLDAWHLAQKFTALPTLNSTFIQDTPPVSRVIAVPSQPEFICDMFFKANAARPLPMFGVPGLIDHF